MYQKWRGSMIPFVVMIKSFCWYWRFIHWKRLMLNSIEKNDDLFIRLTVYSWLESGVRWKMQHSRCRYDCVMWRQRHLYFRSCNLTFNVTVETFSLGTMSLLIMTTFEFYKLLLGLFGANLLLYLLDVFSCHQWWGAGNRQKQENVFDTG